MPIKIIDTIKPDGIPLGSSQFPTVEDIDILGGYQVVGTDIARNNIPSVNRKTGMLVYVVADSLFYQLAGDLVTWNAANFALQGNQISNTSPNDAQTLSWVASTSKWTPVNQQVSTISQLRSTNPITATSTINLQGYTSAGDGGGGLFNWNPSSTTADNGGTIIAVTGIGTGRWIRQTSAAYIVNVLWFGGPPNTNHYNIINGKWYQDAGHTAESTDDSFKFQAAVNYLTTIVGDGYGSIYVPAGNYYFKTKQTSYISGSTGNEWVKWANNISMYGDGPTNTQIWIAPNSTSASFKGYSCVFGIYNGIDTTPLQNCTFRDFAVNKQSTFNQWVGANFNSQPNSQIANSVVCAFPTAFNVHYQNVHSLNDNGVFAFILGSYGFPSLTTDCSIDHCVVYNPGQDLNQGDNSMIAGGMTGCQITNCNVIGFRTMIGNSTNSAFEIHGTDNVFANNYVNNVGTGLTSAGDSAIGQNFVISNFIVDNCAIGVELLSELGNNCQGYNVNNCYFNCDFAGIVLDGISSPAAFYNSSFTNNIIVGAVTSLGGFYFLGVTGDGYGGLLVANNRFYNCSVPAIVLTNSTTGQVSSDITIFGNMIENCGPTGSNTGAISILGVTGAGAAQYKRLFCANNKISDTRVTTFYNGIYINSNLDNSCFFDGNIITNYSNADIFFDLSNYPTMSCGYIGRHGTNFVEFSALVSGSTKNFMSGAYSAGNMVWSAGGPLFIDQSGQSTIEARFGSGGSFMISDSGSAEVFLISDSVVQIAPSSVNWLYNATPVLGQNGQISDAPTHPLTIQSQTPFNSATGSNGISGNIVLQVPNSLGGAGGFGSIISKVQGANELVVTHGQTTVNGKLISAAGRRITITPTTISYNILSTDEIISVGTIIAPITINLPVSPIVGDLYQIKDTKGLSNSHNITIDSGAGNTIDASQTFVMNVNYSFITVVCTSTSPNQWSITAK